MMQFLKERPDVDTVVFCLDNDRAGNQAIQRLTLEVQEMERDYQIQIEQSVLKDWNEDLVALEKTEPTHVMSAI